MPFMMTSCLYDDDKYQSLQNKPKWGENCLHIIIVILREFPRSLAMHAILMASWGYGFFEKVVKYMRSD